MKSGRLSPSDQVELERYDFSNICTLYETDQLVSPQHRLDYLKKNFLGAKLRPGSREDFLKINWPYIYTLNIDDAIEKSSQFDKVIVPKREFRDEIFNDFRCIIKIHGDINELITYDDSAKVFTSLEYLQSLDTNRKLLDKLKTDYSNNNIVYIGCSLDDELDLLMVSSIHLKFEHRESKTRVFYCTVSDPSELTKFKLQRYGITDIILFESYDTIYQNIYEAWTKSQEIHLSQLDAYKAYSIKKLGTEGNDRQENKNFFMWAKSPANIKDRIMTITFSHALQLIVDIMLQTMQEHFGLSDDQLREFMIKFYDRLTISYQKALQLSAA